MKTKKNTKCDVILTRLNTRKYCSTGFVSAGLVRDFIAIETYGGRVVLYQGDANKRLRLSIRRSFSCYTMRKKNYMNVTR